MNNNRIILNANEGITNSISNNDLYTVILNTVSEIKKILLDHCGPFATNAMIIFEQGMGRGNPNIFTKDGINILDSMEFVSPVQAYIKNLISHIGSRVDSVAHDGTTTSMLIACNIIEYIITTRLMTQYKEKRHVINTAKGIITELEDIKKQLNENKITVDELAEFLEISREEAVSKLAFTQAMISSKNDVELSQAMAEIFKHTPKEMYSYFSFYQNSVESNKVYEVMYPEHDFSFRIVPYTMLHYNHNLGTEYLLESCDLIVIPEELANGHTMNDVLFKHLETTTIPTVLVLNKRSDSSMVRKMCTINPNVPITPVQFVSRFDFSHVPLELISMNVSAGVRRFFYTDSEKDLPFVIHNVKCHIETGYMHLSNLYKYDEVTKLHPYYVDKDANPDYTRFIDEMTLYIEKLNAKVDADPNQINDAITVLRNTISGRIPILKIGGRVLDVHANRSVAQDVLGAITSVLEKGFIIDGNFKIYRILKSYMSEGEDFRYISHTILKDILKAIYDCSDDETFREIYIDLHLANINKKPELAKYVCQNIDASGIAFKEIKVPVIQPIMIYNELIDRLIEVIPKLISSVRVIVPGTAAIEEKK